MTTVTALKRALEECIALPPERYGFSLNNGLCLLAGNPTMLTILANRLSDRGEAGNEATRRHLGMLKDLADRNLLSEAAYDALEWAIDQLTPPERVQS